MGHHIGRPDIFTDWHTNFDALKRNRLGHRACGKDALFIKHAIVRQVLFGPNINNLALLDQKNCIKACAVNVPWCGQQQRRTILTFGRMGANYIHRIAQMTHERRLHHQILGRIARQNQFRIQNDIRALISSSFPGRHNLVPVPGYITDNRVELGNRNGKHICHDVGIRAPPRTVNCRITNIACSKRARRLKFTPHSHQVKVFCS